MKTLIECGANIGLDSQALLDKYGKDCVLYVIEPCIELVHEYLIPRLHKDSRVRICPWAIDSTNGFKKFNISNDTYKGCSSLYEFTEDVEELWLSASGQERWDFKVSHSYTVPTMTLYDFCELYNIKNIDYLWIDTQGNDFNVLKSLKDKISIVKEGQCEVASLVELYKNTENLIGPVVKWLREQGFETSWDLDTPTPEEDVFFWREGGKERF